MIAPLVMTHAFTLASIVWSWRSLLRVRQPGMEWRPHLRGTGDQGSRSVPTRFIHRGVAACSATGAGVGQGGPCLGQRTFHSAAICRASVRQQPPTVETFGSAAVSWRSGGAVDVGDRPRERSAVGQSSVGLDRE